MGNLLATQSGYYYEIKKQQLVYIGPAELSGEHLFHWEHLQMLFGWFMSDWKSFEEDDPTAEDDLIAQAFAQVIKAEVSILKSRPSARSLFAA